MNIKSDSRRVKPGDIFVALRGIDGDGHKFISAAIKNGASKVIVEEDGDYGVETLKVKSTRAYLNAYLESNYGSIIDDMQIIGITGTNGKTTTAYLIYEALNMLNIKCAYIGTIGFYLDKKIMPLENTCPDTALIYEMLLNAHEKGYKYVVIEASSQGLSYGRLDTIKFSYALFTNLTQDHLDYHKTMENYAQAKQKLFENLKPNGLRIVNNDSDYVDYYKTKDAITYGFSPSDYQVTDYSLDERSTSFVVNGVDNIKTKLLGKYNIYNVLLTYVFLDRIGVLKKDIINIISKLLPPPGRLDLIHYKDNNIVIDYAHTPDAMENIIATMKEVTKGNIYIVFGCTGSRDRSKRPIMMDIALSNSKFSIITSDDLHDEEFVNIVADMEEGVKYKNYAVFRDRRKAIEKGIEMLEHNDSLLILGKGHEEFIIDKNLKIPFNDHNVVESIISEKVEI